MDGGNLIAGILVSGLGFVFFSYGRKMSRPPQVIGGIALMGFPYFLPHAWLTLLVGALLVGLIWLAIRFGY